MPGRLRRARALIAVVFVALVFFLYQRNSTTADQYADYIREKTVGGGAVLRDPVEAPNAPAARTTSVAAQTPTPPAPTTAPTPLVADAAVAYEDPRDEDGLTNAQWPLEVGEGRIDAGIPTSRSTSKPVHWTKQPEQFPISSTIQLPNSSPKAIPRIQHEKRGSADTERLAAVKEATRFSWEGYTSIALGFDEVMPVSGMPKNSFNGWGATLVDSLDALWIMGMTKEFEEAVEEVRKIDFTTSPRSDIPLFEVTIRYFGGLLAAYDVSDAKYRILLDKAVELAEILYGAFDTPNRMPITYYHWKPDASSQPHRAGARVVLAELGTLSLEFTRLAQITGEPKYYDAVARITDAFDEWQNRTRLPGMWPTSVDASGCRRPEPDTTDTWDFREQTPPMYNDLDQSGGAPNFYSGSDQLAGAPKFYTDNDLKTPETVKTEHDELLVGKPQAAAPQANVADNVRDETESETLKRKRQLNLGKTASDQTSPVNPHVIGAKFTTTEDTRTGREVCLEAGLNSTSTGGSETFTLGGMSDSVYEYLPKEYLLLGGRLDQYKDIYLYSAQTIIEKLLFRPMTPENRDLLFTGDMQVSINYTTGEKIEKPKHKSEHLSCFVGGMFGMGGKIFGLPQHVEIGRRLTDGCIWAYNSTATGIMPETFLLSACPDINNCKWNQTQYWEELDPYVEDRVENPEFFRKKVYYTDLSTRSSPMKPTATAAIPTSTVHPVPTETLRTGPKPLRMPEAPANVDPNDRTLRKRQLGEAALGVPKPAVANTPPSIPDYSNPSHYAHGSPNRYRPTTTQPDVEEDPSSYYYVEETQEDYVRDKIASQRIPPGFVQLNSRAYILRPEAIESVFYMYRITGEQHWRDAGWRMFQAVQNATRAQYGHSAIHDVTADEPMHTDGMESFWIAETLKYFYLLFDDPANWSLDDWVLNTEAHFFRRPENPAVAASVAQMAASSSSSS